MGYKLVLSSALSFTCFSNQKPKTTFYQALNGCSLWSKIE